jgi:hypothetical protein
MRKPYPAQEQLSSQIGYYFPIGDQNALRPPERQEL